MVTSVPMDQSYDFPWTELAAMSDNIAWLIQDIDKLDGHWHNMIVELKVLRDITLFYNERHPELNIAGSTARPKEDINPGSARQHGNTTSPDKPGPTTADNNQDGDEKKGETKKTI